ncbi:MAG: nucleotidyltransferase [Clostridia bacterium]|nr:nucleotidyltransferase [Clostridia bacterium]
MKVLGIIAEYNPFHLGHLYHLQTAKRKINPTATIAILSSNFLQRGEPALIDKWARCETALRNGIDLVLELPVAFSSRSAMWFASGGVQSLAATGIVTHLAFGAESSDLKKLQLIADFFNHEEHSFQKSLDEYLKQGFSFPHARSLALNKVMGSDANDFINELNNPNNILAIAYLRNLALLSEKIEPVLVKRLGNYHAQRPENQFASATAIRRLIKEKNSSWVNYVPETTKEVLLKKFQDREGPVFLENLEQGILSCLRRMSPAEISNIIEVNEGLENRLWKMALETGTIYELIEKLKTKRYTHTRIQRLLIHLYLGFTKNDVFTQPYYLRVLGFNEKGQKLLKLIKTKARLPIITKLAHGYKNIDESAKKMLELEIRATDLYTLAYPDPQKRKGRLDFYRSPIVITTDEQN